MNIQTEVETIGDLAKMKTCRFAYVMPNDGLIDSVIVHLQRCFWSSHLKQVGVLAESVMQL